MDWKEETKTVRGYQVQTNTAEIVVEQDKN
ncbi:DUF1257 domain-containing protein [cyanobacterium endosymbiont of Rhopalodia gibberula]